MTHAFIDLAVFTAQSEQGYKASTASSNVEGRRNAPVHWRQLPPWEEALMCYAVGFSHHAHPSTTRFCSIVRLCIPAFQSFVADGF